MRKMRLFVMLMAIAAVSFTFTSCDDDPWDDDYWDDPYGLSLIHICYMHGVDVAQTEAFEAGMLFARVEGIIPAPESCHARCV